MNQAGNHTIPSPGDSWGGHRRITLAFLAGLLVLLGIFTFQVAQPFVWPAITAVILAVAFHPLHAKLVRLTRRPGLAAALSMLLAILLTLLPAAVVTVLLTSELRDIYGTLNARQTAQGGWWPFLNGLWQQVGGWLAAWLPGTIDPAAIEQEAVAKLQSWSGQALAKVGTFLGGFAVFLFNLILTYFILFFLFRDGSALIQAILDSLPIARGTAERLLRTARETLSANLYGVLGVALGQGGLMTAGLLIIGFPSPMLWGVLAALLSMLPLIGAWLLWIPIAGTLALQGAWAKAIFLAIWGAAVVGLSDNVIRPWVVMRGTQQHPLLILLSILGGTHAFGFLGLLIGPIVVTLTLAVFATLREAVRGDSIQEAETLPAGGAAPIIPASPE